MDYIFAIFFPGLVLLLKGRILAAIALIALQLTILGWIPATLIAFFISRCLARIAAQN